MTRGLVVLVALVACGDPLQPLDAPSCGPWRGGAWDERFVVPGLSGSAPLVTSLVRLPDGRLAVAGEFERALGMHMRSPAVWDGARWAPLGDALPGLVLDLALDDAGVVWAVGETFVARLEGTVWNRFTEHAHGIRGIEAIAGGIAVHGEFATIGGIEAHGLATWTGAWASGELAERSSVRTLVRTANGLCAGGVLWLGDPSAVASAGCWDGASWSPLGNLVGYITALARSPAGRWVAGGDLVFAQPNGEVTARGLATLDDAGTWVPFDGGIHPRTSLWNDPHVAQLAFEGDELIVAGSFSAVGPPPTPTAASGLARWSPRLGWKPLADGGASDYRAAVHAFAIDGARLHVAGDFTGMGNVLAAGGATIEADGTITPWTGGRGPFAVAGWIRDLVVTSAGMIALGELSATGVINTPIAILDGSWHALPGEAPASDASSAVELADRSLVIASDRVSRWGGQRWTQLTSEPSGHGPLLAAADGALFFTRATEASTQIVRWHDGALTSFGHLEGHTTALALFDDALVALVATSSWEADAGASVWVRRDEVWRELWSAADASPVDLQVSPVHGLLIATTRGVHAWDGTRWTILTSAPVTAIAACADGVFAGRGWIEDGWHATQVELHDGVGWHALGPAQPGLVTSLASSADGLHVGVAAPHLSAVVRWARP